MKIPKNQIPILATTAVCVILFVAVSLRYPAFFSGRVFIKLFSDNAVLGIAAVGMTFVILSGGIDLSVGAMVGAVSIVLAALVTKLGWPPLLAMGFVLVLGTCFGAGMGALIRFFAMPPFLVTLAGMFLARGLGFITSLESIGIDHPVYSKVAEWRIPLGQRLGMPATAVMFLAVLGVALVLAHYTRFGRAVYAIGGNEQSALLMGLPVGSIKIRIYALGGFCSALAGVVYTFYTFSGNSTAGTGLELDAIAAVVVGGTLLSGGVGYVAGTLVGVLIFGIIQTAIIFQGTLSSWWTKIAIGILLLLFVLLQKIIQPKRAG